MSVDAPLKDESDSTLLTVLPSGEESIEEALAKRQLHGALKEAVTSFEASLKEKERKIFQGRVIEEDRVTLQELSDELSISKERVRQIENRLREKLKAHVAAQLGAELNEWIEPDAAE